MSGTTMVVVIVCVVFGVMYEIYKKNISNLKQKTLKHSKTADEESSQLRQQVEKLTERVQVLEKK